MTRKFIGTVLSAALIATSFTAAPARADEDVAKVLGGLLVLGVLAKAIERNKAKDQHHEVPQVSRRHVERGHLGSRDVKPGHVYRPHRPHRHAKVATPQCRFQTWTHRGLRQVYGARCLQKSVRAQLPQACLRQNHTRSGPRYYYNPRCLTQHGWRA